jgi:L-alanine-DL-glutamate epimerase-like enolase superfamily enzyme
VPVATGEHVYTRWQSKDLLVQGAADVLQNDPDWTGGISEQMSICALASSFEVPVVAHGHSLLPPLHVAAAQSPTTVPYVEYLVQFQETKQAMLETFYRPVNGVVRVPEAPGLGMVLDEARLESKRPISISLA